MVPSNRIERLTWTTLNGAEGGTRTHGVLTVPDYKSGAVATEPPQPTTINLLALI